MTLGRFCKSLAPRLIRPYAGVRADRHPGTRLRVHPEALHAYEAQVVGVHRDLVRNSPTASGARLFPPPRACVTIPSTRLPSWPSFPSSGQGPVLVSFGNPRAGSRQRRGGGRRDRVGGGKAPCNGGSNTASLSAVATTAAKLERAFQRAIETYYRLKRGAHQTVRVEHVHVHDGGQAVIGNVGSG
jgi:hypothetical protein